MNKYLYWEAAVMHLLTWWGIRVLATRLPLAGVIADETSLWLVRLSRAGVMIALVLAWARWRNIPGQHLGLGGQHFARNFIAAAGVTVALGFAIAIVRGTLWDNPLNGTFRIFASAARGVDALAQQLSVFGLLQKFLDERLHRWVLLGLTLFSFSLAHFIIGGFPFALLGGALFGLLLWWTGNLGASWGMHFGFHFAVLHFMQTW